MIDKMSRTKTNFNIQGAKKLFSTKEQEFLCWELNDFSKEFLANSFIHRLSGVTFILLTAGELEIKTGYEHHFAKESELIIVQPNKPFSLEKYSNNIKGYVLHIRGKGILGSMGNHSLIFSLEYLESWSNSLFRMDHLPKEFMVNIFKRIYWERKQETENLVVVNAYVITLLLELHSFYNIATSHNRAAIDLFRRFKKEVYKSLNLQISISEYAELLAVTPNHLNKSVKSVTGKTASDILTKVKIIEAKFLLMSASLTIADVGTKLGYDDTSYFTRFFKKHEGLTPSEYRRMIDLS